MKNKLKLIIVIALAVVLNTGLAKVSFASDSHMLVAITSKCCSTCQKLEPVLEDLESEFSGQITFLKLYVSSREQFEEAKQLAEENGISKYFEDHLGAVPRVAILCPGGTKVEKEFLGETRKEVYEETINKLLSDSSTICSL